MKKIIALVLLLALVLSISACGGEANNTDTNSVSDIESITMQEIYEASVFDTVLSKHESVYIVNTASDGVYQDYITKDYSYELTPYFTTFTSVKTMYFDFDDECMCLVPIDKDGVSNYAEHLAENNQSFVDPNSVEFTTITSTTKTDDRIVVNAVVDTKYFEGQAEEGAAQISSCEWKIELDAETREIAAIGIVYTFDDGTVTESNVVIKYGAEVIDEVKPFLEYENQTENLRTITVVLNPGTEDEKTETIQVPKGLYFELDSEALFATFVDADCTEPLTFADDYESDVTVYIKWAE